MNSGVGEEPELLLMTTVYERENGGEDFGYPTVFPAFTVPREMSH
jgi:hypothetical protein